MVRCGSALLLRRPRAGDLINREPMSDMRSAFGLGTRTDDTIPVEAKKKHARARPAKNIHSRGLHEHPGHADGPRNLPSHAPHGPADPSSSRASLFRPFVVHTI